MHRLNLSAFFKIYFVILIFVNVLFYYLFNYYLWFFSQRNRKELCEFKYCISVNNLYQCKQWKRVYVQQKKSDNLSRNGCIKLNGAEIIVLFLVTIKKIFELTSINIGWKYYLYLFAPTTPFPYPSERSCPRTYRNLMQTQQLFYNIPHIFNHLHAATLVTLARSSFPEPLL